MKRLPEEIVRFFDRQNYVIVSTVDRDGFPHNSCKGLVRIAGARLYLLDLYRGTTLANLRRNRRLSVTAVDEHRFSGYCLKGKGKIVKAESLSPSLLSAWEKRINGRIAQRLLKNLRGEKGHRRHPEALLPNPVYVMEMDVIKVIDLTPGHIRDERVE